MKNMKDYKLLAETIYTRKSYRQYLDESIDILQDDLIKTFNITPLIEDIKVEVKVLNNGEVKNNRSNYCIAFYSEQKPLSLENIGFIGQQIDLELQSRGYGTCWWGMKKPKKGFKKINNKIDGLDITLECIITMSVGKPEKFEKRNSLNEFKRKKVSDIIIGETKPDKYIETVRIAPSAVNMQPWLIDKIDNQYNFYLRSPKGIVERAIGYIRHIDIGIAMAHLFIQAKADDLNISFDFNGKDKTEGIFIASANFK